jgi:hypothetical protein
MIFALLPVARVQAELAGAHLHLRARPLAARLRQRRIERLAQLGLHGELGILAVGAGVPR